LVEYELLNYYVSHSGDGAAFIMTHRTSIDVIMRIVGIVLREQVQGNQNARKDPTGSYILCMHHHILLISLSY